MSDRVHCTEGRLEPQREDRSIRSQMVNNTYKITGGLLVIHGFCIPRTDPITGLTKKAHLASVYTLNPDMEKQA
ncbi:hypothetical protein PsorP6_016066 [Peronosclerospora sorghi]|uniref:Uncharacterized protein n=1 Tax=Peronosclerospora sorghi TaxID=230839 RepID=A0ACC0WNR7_9STRA|nr:hypothetical protein PsorP6_016066 [Peronosclerospora sorghi]